MVYKSSTNNGGGGGGGGTVTQINTGTGLTGGPITSTGTISVADGTPDSLAGYDGTGEFSGVTVGSGLTLTGGVLTATGGSPGGSNTQVQFNDSGSFGGDADFTWNKTTNKLTVGGIAEIYASSNYAVYANNRATEGVVLSSNATSCFLATSANASPGVSGNAFANRMGVGGTLTSIDTRYTHQIKPLGGGVGLGVIGSANDYENGLEFGSSTTNAGGVYWLTSGSPRVQFTTVGHGFPMEFGNNWMYMTTAGNIGMATNSPQSKLHVLSPASGTKGLIVQGTTSQTANLTEWQNVGATALSVVNAAGYLGIQTTNPLAPLNVGHATAGSLVDLLRFSYTPDPTGYYWSIRTSASGSTGGNLLAFYNISGPSGTVNPLTLSDVDVQFNVRPVFTTNVGIGLTALQTPQGNLEIATSTLTDSDTIVLSYAPDRTFRHTFRTTFDGGGAAGNILAFDIATTTSTDIPALVLNGAGTAAIYGAITSGVNGTIGGSLKLFGSTSGDATIRVAAAAGTATVFQLPANNGTNGYVLQTNGSGVTSWVAPSGGGMSIGGTVTSGTTGSILFVGSGPVLAQDNANFFWDDTNNRLGIGTTTPTAALDVGAGRITGGTFSSTLRTYLDLSGPGSFPAADFIYPAGGIFRAGEVGVAGTNDVFFQALPATTSGYGYLEAWNAAGLILGTGNTSSPVIFKPNRTEIARITAAGSVVVTSTNTAALVVGRQGATNPVLQVDASASSVVTGVKITGNATTGRAAIDAISDTGNAALRLRSLANGDLELTTPGTGTVNIQPNGTTRYAFGQSNLQFTPTTLATASTVRFLYTGAANTTLTGGAEFVQTQFNMAQTNQHASNTAITTNRDMLISGMNHSFASSGGVITNVGAFSVAWGNAGTNATITHNAAIYIPTATITGTVTNAYGARIEAPSGATNNYAASVTGTSLVDGEIRVDGTPTSDHSANGPTTNTFNAGVTVTAIDLLYLASDGKWALADADAASTSSGMLAIALAAGTNNNPLLVATAGSYVRDDTWNWTPGQILYVDTTAAAITATAPSGSGDIVRVVGYALTADVIYFMPSGAWVEVT